MGIGRTYIIICDIDNCFVDSRSIFKYAPDDTYDGWEQFHKHLVDCTPNKSVIDLVKATAEIIPIYFLTGREDANNSREVTIKQIEDFSDGLIKIGNMHKLYMRNKDDYRPSWQCKQDMLIDVVKKGFIPLLAIDDDEDNCKMFAKYEIPTNKYNIETDTMEKYFVRGELVGSGR